MTQQSDLARAGYEAYAKSTGGKTYDGREMPKWDELPTRIQNAWKAAAKGIVAGFREQAVSVLNELVAADVEAIKALALHRVGCNEALANHPTCQVVVGPDGCRVGMMGVLNAVFGSNANGVGFIAGAYDAESGKLVEFLLTGQQSSDPGPSIDTSEGQSPVGEPR